MQLYNMVHTLVVDAIDHICLVGLRAPTLLLFVERIMPSTTFPRQPTIAAALTWATTELRSSSPSARLDAELLLAHVLGMSRAHLLAEGRAMLADAFIPPFCLLVERRMVHEPVAYLVGQREFYGLLLHVDERVLVPRPETELLIELTLQEAQRRSPGGQGLTIADIGTGSGCIAAALATHLPAARIIASDRSADALVVARLNLEHHGLHKRVELRQGDLLAPLHEPIDILVSNPPYTIFAEVDEGVRRYEPQLALDGGPDGLDCYRRLIAAAPARLAPHGCLLLEIGAWQSSAVGALVEHTFPGADIRVYQDLAGLDRVMTVMG